MKQKIITVIGSLNMDLVTVTERVPIGGETLHATSFHTGCGGKGGNGAVACGRLSRQSPANGASESDIGVNMIAAVGDDEFGNSLIQGLKNGGVNTDGVKVRENMSSGIAIIIVEQATGENRILVSKGANATLLPSSFPTPESLGTPLPDWLILQLEIPLETVSHILALAHSAHIPVILNPAPAVPLPDSIYTLVHTLIVNEGEAALLSGRTLEEVDQDGFDWRPVAEYFLSKGTENVIITLGAKGAFIKSSSIEEMIPAEKVEKVVDTTAAGDTFVGAYAVNLARQGGKAVMRKKDIMLACRASAKTIQVAGAQNSIPWADEVQGFH